MLGKKSNQMAMFQYINLEELIPENHILRRIDKAVDFTFLHDLVAPLYAEKGRPSIDPEVALRAMLIGYLFDLNDHRLHQELQMHAGYRWFCRLDFNTPVPERSSLIKIRERWAEAGVLDRVLDHIIRQCREAGLLRGDVAIDGTLVQANAAIKSLERMAREHEEEAVSSSTDDDDDDPKDPPPRNRQAGDPDFHNERFSNATHRSKTDPDARLFRKGKGKEAQLCYMVHYVVDVPSGVILGVEATRATGDAERSAARRLLKEARRRLPATAPGERRKWVSDGGYEEKTLFAEAIRLGFDPYVPVKNKEMEPIPTWKRRTSKLDQQLKRAVKVRCAKACNYVRSLNLRPLAKIMQHFRKRVEHLFAEGKEHHGLRRARGRGLPRVQQQAILTAIVQNMKRLVNALHRHRPAGEGAGVAYPIDSPRNEHSFGLSCQFRWMFS
ncbi:transposase [Planifilum fimeticola]|uniref:Transposase n=2 Tax=Planifilum fimeticola TaxID=201975 RepID=A0A2T0L9Q5_9BACL|nr:transposase [Planifilum fimeticola]